MANKRDYYEVLGISKNANESDIKSHFRKFSMKYHPDRQSGKSDSEKKEAEERFKEIAEAYEVLSDKDKRANYDQFGFDGPKMQGNGFNGFDMREFMRRHASMFSGFSGGGFNPFGFDFDQEASQYHEPDFKSPENGRDIKSKIDITFKESMFGCEKEFAIDSTEPCSECKGTGVENGTTPTTCNRCNGTGRIVHTEQHGFMMSQTVMPCPDCNGNGVKMSHCHKCHGNKRTSTKKKLSVKIPQGISSGQRIRIPKHGECGLKGGENGDMYIFVNVLDNQVFSREDNNLYLKYWIDPMTASLGGNIDITTPYKKLSVKIPAGIESGKKLRIHNEGVKTQNNGTGDLYIEINIESLSDLDPAQKELSEKLMKTISKKNCPKRNEVDASIANVLK